ncbi:MAG: ABC transporter permease [Erysipelotrichaceae bacterium]|nr:ABC transporter permease [Erysipelotrichaceae bacterium]
MSNLLNSVLELGLINALTVLALFVSYRMLDICDLSTDGCFTLGASVGAVVAISLGPYMSLLAAVAAGMLCGLVTSLLQTKMGVNSLLAGIAVNTALYSVNIAVMSGSALINLNRTTTVFTLTKQLLSGTPLAGRQNLVIALIAVILTVLFLNYFLRTRLGLALRATGDNHQMVEASSIDSQLMKILGLTLSSGMTALSGCLLAQSQKSASIDLGSGILTIALASLLIGKIFFPKGKLIIQLTGSVIGSLIFRFIYALALKLNMPAYMLKLVSSAIVLLAISLPYLQKQYPLFIRRLKQNRRA